MSRPVRPADTEDDDSRLIALAVLATVAFLALYALAVLTEPGQRLDEAALTGSAAVPARAELAAGRLLSLVSIGTLAAAIAALSAIAWLDRDPRALILPVAIVGGSLLATELLKLGILQRPALVTGTPITANSYPSGHTTVAVSVGMAALAVCPARLRGPVALAAAALAAAGGVLVVTAEWHRPSDAVGSYLLTLAVTAGALVWVRRGRSPGRGSLPAASPEHVARARRSARRVELLAGVAAAGVFSAAALYASVRYGPDVSWNRFHAAYLASVAAIVAAAGLSVAALVRAMHAPRERGPGRGRPSDSVGEPLQRRRDG